jgi:outer membrane immunogenic protein
MRKVLGLVGATLLFAGPASAADLLKAPAMPPGPVSNWTGFYAGGNIGWAWDASTTASFGPANAATNVFFLANEFPTALSPSPKGLVGGAQIGYNWQISQWLLGVETDFQGSAYTGKATATPVPVGFAPFTTSVTQDNSWFGTVRGRLGFLVTPSLLVYGTGGLAYGKTEVSFTTFGTGLATCPSNFTCATGASSSTRTGWAGGGGLEYMFAPNWSAKAEYLYVDLGSQSVTAFSPNFPTTFGFTATATYHENIVRAGVNYHF